MAPESSSVSPYLVVFHHLPDSNALLANDVAMQLIRHLHILCYGHQRLKEESQSVCSEILMNIKQRHISA